MAKITVKDIDEKVAAAAAERDRLKAESREADSKKGELERLATAAAEEGRLEDYRALKRQATAIEEESFVRAAQLGKLKQPVEEKDVFDAWADYAAAYNKALAARLSEAEKKMNAYLDEYEAAVKLQNEALAVRERLAKYLGQDITGPGKEPQGFIMDFIPTAPMMQRPPVNDAVAAFFLSQRKADRQPGNFSLDPVTNRVVSVVFNHRST